jgi:hypothetical protein
MRAVPREHALATANEPFIAAVFGQEDGVARALVQI